MSVPSHHVASPFPEEPYSFSTLWAMYVSGDTQKLQVSTLSSQLCGQCPTCYSKPICPSSQMQLRDYPQPLLAMTEVTISGRILFAEQEAQERGTCSVASK